MIAASIAGLDTANAALDTIYREKRAALRHHCQQRSALAGACRSSVRETLVAQRAPTDAVPARMHAELGGSERELAAYIVQPAIEARLRGTGKPYRCAAWDQCGQSQGLPSDIHSFIEL
ncbi:hypothetical protein G3A43_42470 [Paraburkholderia aspalathi]|uniref:hypothetical protein n=1 Tax=Paraburkholderia nemoris TaxID=2793076 RepID=UPI00190BB52D|nr:MULTISPECIES: hypothetical protein [Paraburkholderia]MBK3786846.1 hypothetical protein [Paraburkholderia aspalathi]